ncbi:hypothetical protein D7030_10440 [Flavobacteriaceae bacterium AU392]|nr:hypothetical protein D1817_06365 [Flavobacteriaceae bacterium]RKM83705.1 hypothetical protein D7030_10440 [Flavobacteriaceae bacterium AU392]
MKLHKSIYFFIFLFLFTSLYSYAQQKRRINIVYSARTEKVENQLDATRLRRDDSRQVEIYHNGVLLFCDEAVHYADEGFIEAYGNVRINQGDTITMSSKYLDYSLKTQLAVAKGDVVLTEPNSILSSQQLYFDRVKQQAYYDNNGKVVRDSSGIITSKIGRYYFDAKKYQFEKDVVLVDPEYIINTEQLDFYSETGNAYLFGPSTITTEDSKTYCERGFFDTEQKLGYAVKNSRIDYDNRTIEGDSLFFDNKRNFASATNNIKVTDTINNAVVKGHYAEVYKDKDSVFITKRALAITVQENDSIYMHSDIITVTGKPENRITRAYYNAKIYKSDLSGKADSINVNHKKGITTLLNLKRFSSTDAFTAKRNPILWNLGNQMTGDTIQLIANKKTETLDTLKVFNDAFLVSKDTLGDGYNQVIGKQLFGFFKDNKLRQVDIVKNAESIYYSREENGDLFGVDRSRSAIIRIFINEDNSKDLRKIGPADGNLYPLEEFIESLRRFKGFDWRDDERPKSVEDLFKDDPPLELPIIKGLDDYIPQEDFFDKELLDRINNAANKTLDKDGKLKENKAARGVPQKAIDKKDEDVDEDESSSKN